MKRFIVCLMTLSFLFVMGGTAMSVEVITNGDFETGDFTGWIVDIYDEGVDMWVINDGTIEFELPYPWSTIDGPYDPISGNYDAVSDVSAYGGATGDYISILFQQTVTLPSYISSATLSWSDRIRNYAEDFNFGNIEEAQLFGVLFENETVFITLPGDDLMQIEPPNLRSVDVTEIAQSMEDQVVTLAFIVAAEDGPLFVTVDDVSLDIVLYTVLPVEIDIKPGSDPNCFNNDGHGVIPVAILGSVDFDVNTIDTGSVMLEGLAVKAVGKSNKLLAHYEDVNGDGYNDLVVQIEDDDLVFEEGDTTATVSGSLNDGMPFQGSDTICIVP